MEKEKIDRINFLAKKKKAEQTRQARAAKRASPYLQNKFQTSKVLQKKLKAIFDE